jgi:hypothetical protein
VWTNNVDHLCVVYDGPECPVDGCEHLTVAVSIAPPGVGHGVACEAGHYTGTSRELTVADVI